MGLPNDRSQHSYLHRVAHRLFRANDVGDSGGARLPDRGVGRNSALRLILAL
jgi:hypothetical protein